MEFYSLPNKIFGRFRFETEGLNLNDNQSVLIGS